MSRKWMIENKMGDRHALTASLEFASLAAFNRAPQLHIICNTNMIKQGSRIPHPVGPMVVSRPPTTRSAGGEGRGQSMVILNSC